ncbi:MAG: ATP-binding protein [Deltaproteobacteria bacterium]|nr:ATP-binding protein [Deltaproteobacteria bacterium]
MDLIDRKLDVKHVKGLIDIFPVVAILGPRQCGKTTLAKQFPYTHYFDLENPRDLAMLEHPQLALDPLDGMIVIDEIQQKPDLFLLLRFLVDHHPEQRYLILGSASRDLIRQSSETLAGRIGYFTLGGLRISDVGTDSIRRLWLRGGLPRSYLIHDDEGSAIWRENYIATFLERDIPQLGIGIPAKTLGRFWTMLSHYHGQMINYSELGRNFGISYMTARRYLDLLEGTFMIRQLRPWFQNVGKRLVKRPKLYFRDSGVFHTLIAVRESKDLLAHNKLGASWEGFSLESVIRSIGKREEDLHFWSTHSGSEIDLFWQQNGKNWAVEFKYMDAPKHTRSMAAVLEDLELEHLWIVYPGNSEYRLSARITVKPLANVADPWEYAIP